MSEERTTKITTASICTRAHLSQQCLCCENTREVPYGFSAYSQFVCDECREAIAFVKELKYKQENFDPLKPVLD